MSKSQHDVEDFMSTVLIVEDVPLQAKLLQAYFKQMEGVDCVIFNDPVDGLEWCEHNEPDLILLDMIMPRMHGLEFLKKVRALEHMVEIPIIVISAQEKREVLYDALELGANDFLRKPVDSLELVARAKNMLQLRARQIEIKTINASLYEMATTDALTSVSNRRHFLTCLDEEIARVRRKPAPLALAMIDADHFKSVNDTYGHPTGDRVLIELARSLSQGVRTIDRIGRLGGEEFAILMPETSKEGAHVVCERVREAIAALEIELSDGGILRFTISIGVATYEGDTDSSELLIQRVDAALYEAKEGGRNRVVHAACAPNEQTGSKAELFQEPQAAVI